MQLGKMYLVKEFFWFLYPTKEVAEGLQWAQGIAGARAFEATYAASSAKWLSERCKCNVSFFEPKTYVVLLKADEDERFYKLLDSNGNIGWIGCNQSIGCSDFSKYFEASNETKNNL